MGLKCRIYIFIKIISNELSDNVEWVTWYHSMCPCVVDGDGLWIWRVLLIC